VDGNQFHPGQYYWAPWFIAANDVCTNISYFRRRVALATGLAHGRALGNSATTGTALIHLVSIYPDLGRVGLDLRPRWNHSVARPTCACWQRKIYTVTATNFGGSVNLPATLVSEKRARCSNVGHPATASNSCASTALTFSGSRISMDTGWLGGYARCTNGRQRRCRCCWRPPKVPLHRMSRRGRMAGPTFRAPVRADLKCARPRDGHLLRHHSTVTLSSSSFTWVEAGFWMELFWDGRRPPGPWEGLVPGR